MSPSLLVLLLVGCGAPEPIAEVTPAEPLPAEAAVSPVDGPTAAPAAPPLPPRTVKLEVGPLADQLKAQAAEAKRQGLTPFVQVYGDWCASCRKLRDAMGDPAMVDAFEGTWIVRLDTSLWGPELQGGLWVREGFSVPAFFRLNDDGTFGGTIDGSAWGEDTAANMAPKLKAFFGAHGASATR